MWGRVRGVLHALPPRGDSTGGHHGVTPRWWGAARVPPLLLLHHLTHRHGGVGLHGAQSAVRGAVRHPLRGALGGLEPHVILLHVLLLHVLLLLLLLLHTHEMHPALLLVTELNGLELLLTMHHLRGGVVGHPHAPVPPTTTAPAHHGSRVHGWGHSHVPRLFLRTLTHILLLDTMELLPHLELELVRVHGAHVLLAHHHVSLLLL